MTVQVWSEPGQHGRPNEDWAYGDATLLAVVDGATSRTEIGCAHGVAWYASQLGEALVNQARDLGQDLRQALARAIEAVAQLHPECDLSHPGTPSAALGMVRRNGDTIEVLVLADVAVIVGDPDGNNVRVIYDDRVSNSATAERASATRLPVDHPDRPAALERMKRAQQREQNQPGGYFVATSDPQIATEATLEVMRAASVGSIAVLSDGAYRAVTPLGQMTPAELLDQLGDKGPRAVIEAVRRAEQRDSNASRWPRTKVSDDATAVYRPSGATSPSD